jgi:subtilisin family serine protease
VRRRIIAVLGAASLAVLSLGVAAPASAAGQASGYIVVLRDSGQDPGAVAAEHANREGGRVSRVYRSALKGYAATMSAQGAANIARDPRVLSVEPDQVATVDAQQLPTGVDRIDDPANNNTALPNLGIDGADDKRVDVDVAIIDTGIDATNPDLNIVAMTDCTGSPLNQTCVDGSAPDGNGHGTHVAGTVGALDNGSGVVGVAPGARISAVRVLNNSGSGYFSWIIAGIDWVTAHGGTNGPISVANMSLGCLDCTSAAMTTAINNSLSAGVVYSVAAGNDDANASRSIPANIANVITVSALADFNGRSGGGGAPTCRADQDDTLADFSNWGSIVDITAPGVCITSTWAGGGLNTISGTSMAAPHVAGAAALLTSQSKPTSLSGVTSIRNQLVAAGNLGWTDDSGDGVQEPLLDVSGFTPRFVATGGGGGGGGAAPTASISKSCSGTTCSFTPTVTNTTSCSWAYSNGGTASGCSTVSRTYSVRGTYTVTLTATGDGGTATATSSVSCVTKGKSKTLSCA